MVSFPTYYRPSRAEDKSSSTRLNIDAGTAAENLLLAAHAFGLAAGPMSSLSPVAVRVFKNMPKSLDPIMFIGLGYPADLRPDLPRWPTKKPVLKIWYSGALFLTVRRENRLSKIG
jgi:nitroreductase